MSTTPSSSSSSSSMAACLDMAATKRENLRKTLETLHSHSNSLLLLSLQWKDLEDYFTCIFDSIAMREEDVHLKSQQIQWKQKYWKRRAGDIQLKEKKFEESVKMADDRCKEVDATYELVKRCYNRVKEREERFRVYNRNWRKRFERKEVKFECKELVVDNREEELRLREMKLGRIERKLLERLQEIDVRVHDIERREKMLDHVKVEEEPLDNVDHNDDDDEGELFDPSYADLRLNVTMDGRALQIFLNGRVNDHEILRDEIIVGLQLSADPAKLVLDAMLGFYPEDLGNCVVGFDLSVVRKSCVLLLEQLIKVKPRIRSRVRERAMRLALEWKERMKVDDGDCYLEVVGFLQLVATYRLTGSFCKDELLALFERCGCHEQAPELCRSLGFTDDVLDIIQNLIIKQRSLEAITLAHAFELFIIFPPVPILKSHLSSTFANAEKVYKNGDTSIEAQVKCINTKLAALISVVRCIKKYGLQCQFPIQPLEKLTSELKRQKKKCNSSRHASEVQVKVQDEELCISVKPVEEGGSPMSIETCSESTLKSECIPTEHRSTSSSHSPYSFDAFGNSTKTTLSLASKCVESTCEPVHTSQMGSSNLGALSESMTGKKRGRVSSVVVAKNSRVPSVAPVSPHLALFARGPFYYCGASSSYDEYIVPPYANYQQLHRWN